MQPMCVYQGGRRSNEVLLSPKSIRVGIVGAMQAGNRCVPVVLMVCLGENPACVPDTIQRYSNTAVGFQPVNPLFMTEKPHKQREIPRAYAGRRLPLGVRGRVRACTRAPTLAR